MPGFDTFLALADKFAQGESITLHAEQCLNTRFRQVDCTRCAGLCPADGAITVTNGRPALDNTACLRCGLCLHACPTNAFTLPDTLSANLVKSVMALPFGPVDLLCPQHPQPEHGPAPQAVQTQRCLAALSPAVLLELAASGREIWLDDTPCPNCPLGKAQPALANTVAEANAWASLLDQATPVQCRSIPQNLPAAPAVSRSVINADRPPISRRGFFGSFKQIGAEVAKTDEKITMVKSGKTVPAAERLPHALPPHRAKILQIIEQHAPATAPTPADKQAKQPLPTLNLAVDSARCTACGLCARFCPTGAIKFISDAKEFALIFQPGWCLGQGCNICQLACPEQAIAAQPAENRPRALQKKPVAAGDLAVCLQCGAPVATGPALPSLCFVCRSSRAADNLFTSLFK